MKMSFSNTLKIELTACLKNKLLKMLLIAFFAATIAGCGISCVCTPLSITSLSMHVHSDNRIMRGFRKFYQ